MTAAVNWRGRMTSNPWVKDDAGVTDDGVVHRVAMSSPISGTTRWRFVASCEERSGAFGADRPVALSSGKLTGPVCAVCWPELLVVAS